MNLIGTTVVVQNANTTHPADVWASCGLPENGDSDSTFLQARDAQDNVFPVVTDGNELLLRVPVLAGEKKTVTLEAAVADRPDSPRGRTRGAPRYLNVASWVTDELRDLIPRFTAVWDGATVNALPIAFVSAPKINGARLRYHFRTRFATGLPIFIDGWFDIFDNQELVEFKLLLSYGTTTNNDTADDTTDGRLSAVYMHTTEEPLVDHWLNKGLTAPVLAGGEWAAQLVNPTNWTHRTGLWRKGEGIRITGAIRCMPPAGEISAATFQDPRFLNTLHRDGGKVECMLASEHWEGRWGPFGAVPRIELAAARAAELTDFYSDVRGRQATASDENQTYEFRHSLKPDTGSSGAQSDFGATACLNSLGYDEPAANYFMGRDLDGWIRRPYLYHEDDGTWMHEKYHPDCETFGLKPHPAHGSDVLGVDYPIPAGTYSHWIGNDEQHRSDNHLHGMYALTRDPSLEPTIRGILALSAMIYYHDNALGSLGLSVSSPRGWGRPLISLAWAYWLGFKCQAGGVIRMMTTRMWNDAAFRRPAWSGKPMKPLSVYQSAYGYYYPGTSTLITGISPWQESICVMGLYACWRVNAVPEMATELQTMFVNAATTVRDYTVYEYGGQLYNTYLYRWNQGDPWPAANLYPIQPNYYVLTNQGFWEWMAPAWRIAEEFDPSTRGQRLLSEMGPSVNREQAQWWAVTPMEEL